MAFLFTRKIREMKRNIKNSIVFILVVAVLLLVVAVSLATTKPISQIEAKDISVSVDPSINTASVSVQNEKWPGLGMQVLSTKNNVWELSSTFGGDIDLLLSNGFNQLRLDLIEHNVDSDLINISKAAVAIGVAQGADMIWGTNCDDTMTATHWSEYRLDVLDAAKWAQANGVYEFTLGNEIEMRVDGVTLTVAQLISNIKSLATEAQAIFTNGNISYSTQPDYLDRWIDVGKGDLDLLALNLYLGWGTGTANYDEALFISRLSDLVNAFGTGGSYLSEFGLSTTSISSYSVDEAIQAEMVKSLINDIKNSGITRAIFFCYYNDSRPFGGQDWGALKTDGTYRKLWNQALTSSNTSL
ncbi:MAG: hypothetical protein ACYCXB_06120 [Candidatus Humimicrobiaceae bacterium]